MTWTVPEISEADDTPLVRHLLAIISAQQERLQQLGGNANEPVRAMIMSPLESNRRCRDIDAATTPESPWARGRLMRLMARRPLASTPFDKRQAKSADPTHSSACALGSFSEYPTCCPPVIPVAAVG